MSHLRFRAWLKNDLKMVFMDQPEYRGQWSFYFVETNDHHPYGVGISHYQGEIERTDSWNPDEIILMQSTGLKDKNGVEIFEGDVVTFDGNMTADDSLGFAPNGWTYGEDSKYAIHWSQEWAAWEPAFTAEDRAHEFFWKYRNHTRSLFIDGQCAVVGNIHANPELLTQPSHD